MQDVLNVLPEAAAIVDQNGIILAVNDHFAAMFDYKKEELLKQPIEILVPDDIKERHVALRQSFMENPVKRDFGKGFCLRGQKKNGTIFRIDVYLGPLKQNDTLVLVRNIENLQGIYGRISALNEKLNDLHIAQNGK